MGTEEDEDDQAHPWFSTPPAPFETLTKPPKLMMLMFVDHSVYNAEMWTAWMRQARADNLEFDLLIHVKKGPANFTTPELQEFVVNETRYTDACNLWQAQMLLFNISMKDPDITH